MPTEKTITTEIAAAVQQIAAAAQVKQTSVEIAYSVTDDEVSMPWIVRIAVVERRRRMVVRMVMRSNAFGFGATIDDAAKMAIADVDKYIAIGWERAEPA